MVGGTETLPRGGGDGIDGVEPMGERHEAAAESVPREIAVFVFVPCAVCRGLWGMARPRLLCAGAASTAGPHRMRALRWWADSQSWYNIATLLTRRG
eukprot:COSAG01_NODE_2829_length_6998_cov_487.185824_1_plen_97_part_00